MPHTFAKPPEPIKLTDRIKRDANRKKVIRHWNSYEVASENANKSVTVPAAAFRNVIGEEALDMHESLKWDAD